MSSHSIRHLGEKQKRKIHTRFWALRRMRKLQISRKSTIRYVQSFKSRKSLTSQLAKKWHPDSNKEKGANERFLEIQSAYDVSY